MHENHGKLFLVVTAGLGSGAVEGGGLQVAVDRVGVLGDKLTALAAGHGENALEDRQDGVLVNVLPVVRHLLGHIVHKVHAASNVKGEVLFHPRLGTANDHHTLLKGLGGGGGDVSLAVIVHGLTVQQATHGHTGIAGAVLGAQHRTDVRVAHQDLGLADFVEAGAGDAVHDVLESLRVERFCVKLSVRHNSILPFLK